jgi:hypothetical protein
VVGDVEVRVVDPYRVGERGSNAIRSAISRVSVAWSKPEEPGSKISTVALWRGVVGVSAVRNARSRARSRSAICHP